jgi:CO/xanthine dehydrogenase FAD-binding subunit
MRTNDRLEGSPDPFRVKYRLAFSDAVREVVRGRTVEEALASLRLPGEDESRFQQLLMHELNALSIFNCARFRLSLTETQAWVDNARPS